MQTLKYTDIFVQAVIGLMTIDLTKVSYRPLTRKALSNYIAPLSQPEHSMHFIASFRFIISRKADIFSHGKITTKNLRAYTLSSLDHIIKTCDLKLARRHDVEHASNGA